MKKLIIIVGFFLWFEARAQTFQYVITVQDELGHHLAGVDVGNFHVRTDDDGIATLNLYEGKNTFVLHLNGYIDQKVEVTVSHILKDNQSTFTLKHVATDAKKIIVKGIVTTSDQNSKEVVPNVQVKLFYSGHELLTRSGEDGAFSFQVPDVNLNSYEWIVHYYHPDYNYVDPYSFTVPKTNFIELHPTLVKKSAGDTLSPYVHFIIYPLPWKKNQWDVLDIGECNYVTKTAKGFYLKMSNGMKDVHLKIVRKDYEDVELIKTREQLTQMTVAENINMNRIQSRKISRFNAGVSLNYSLANNGMFSSPSSSSIALLWHPRMKGVLRNKLAVVGRLSGDNLIQTTDKYQTLSGFVGEIRSTYHLINNRSIGLRYYFKDFTSLRTVIYFQTQANWLTQIPTGYFSKDNFIAERRGYSYVIPSFSVGLRKNVNSFLAFEGSAFISSMNIHSQNFIFNYYGNANAVENETPLVNAGFSIGFIFYFPIKN